MTLVQMLYGDVDVSFEKLEGYFAKVVEHNPGTYAKVEKSGSYFYRSILIPKFCIGAAKLCQEVIALDGTHLKDVMSTNGVLLLATTRDPNNELIILALAIVPVEDGSNWTWFLNHVKAAGIMDKNPVILSDRQKGLINACNTVCPSPSLLHATHRRQHQKNQGALAYPS
ncbi:hypothetical protein AaE_015349 [Aphanomyces astaci]|uniref:MULE transposase domain-containing protein n=1 Tax=Aphanomyces astaci TaxID=112090 RepID=A0A6A4Z279_APHAT|nr:hypothetical protein AaE_015349 [Aphanomyces astaci]